MQMSLATSYVNVEYETEFAAEWIFFQSTHISARYAALPRMNTLNNIATSIYAQSHD
jgi:hypothetical protein